MKRISAIVVGLLLFILALPSILAQDAANSPHSEQIPPPACQSVPDWDSARAATCTRSDIAEWLKDIVHWRAEHLLRMGYNGSEYGGRSSCGRSPISFSRR